MKQMWYIILIIFFLFGGYNVYAGYDPTKTLYPYEYELDGYTSINQGGELANYSHNINAGSGSANNSAFVNILIKDDDAYSLDCYDWYVEFFSEYQKQSGKKKVWVWDCYSAGSINLNGVTEGDVGINETPQLSKLTVLTTKAGYKYLNLNFNDISEATAISQNAFSFRVIVIKKGGGSCGEEIIQEKFYQPGSWAFGGTYQFDLAPEVSTGPTLAVNTTNAGCWTPGGTFDLTQAVGSVSPATATVKYFSDVDGNQEIADPTAVAMPANNLATSEEVINYYARAVDETGATSEMQTIAVTFWQKPEVTLTLGGGASSPVCEGTDVTLVANNVNSFAQNSFRFYCDQFSLDKTVNTPSYTINSFSHAGVYKVYATSAQNKGECIDSAEITIAVTPTIPAGDITITASKDEICSGESVTLTASVSKAEFAGATFEWQAPVADADKNKAEITVSPTGETSYQVKANLNGCPSSLAQNKLIKFNPTPTLKITDPAAVCGGTVDLTASSVTAGSTLGLTLAYYTDANCTTSLTDAINVGAGTYYIKGTTAKGCSASGAVTATVNTEPVPAIAVTGNKTEECSGETLTLTASPDGMSEYTWTVNGTTQSGQTITPALADGTNTFSLTVKDANGCEGTVATPVTVTGLKKPTVTITPVSDDCAGETINLVATADYKDGASGASVAWTGATVADASSLTTTAELAGGDNKYTVTVTDNKGCSGKDEITVKGNELTVSLAANSTMITAGTSVTLTATPQWNGSIDNSVSYTWKKTLPTQESLAGSAKTQTVAPAETSTYEVTVNKGGCTASATQEIQVQLEQFVVGEITGGRTLCENEDLSTGSMKLGVSASGGKTEYSYIWTVPAGVTVMGESTAELEITAIDYTQVPTGSEILVVVSDASTPVQSVTKKYYLAITPLPEVLINGKANGAELAACLNVPLNLTAAVDGVSSGLTFEWATTPATSGATLAAEVGSVGETTYKVKATNNGCSAEASVKVKVNDLPDLTLTATLNGTNVTEVCPGTEVTLLAASTAVTAASKFAWTGATPSGISGTGGAVTAPASGAPEYIVSVTDGTCSNKKSLTLTVHTPGQLSISTDNTTVCANTQVTLTAEGGSDYVWSGDATGNSNPLSVTPDGSKSSYVYKVNGKDANGCEAKEATQTITVTTAPLLALSKTALEECAIEGATIDLKNAVNTDASVTGALSILWAYKDGQTETDATKTTAVDVNNSGTYHLFLKSGECKSVEQTVTTTFNALPDVTLAIADNKMEPCSGETVTLQATGSDGAVFTYAGTNGTSWQITPENTGTTDQDVKYTVIAKNNKNCTRNGEITLKVKSLPDIKITGPTTVCTGSEITLSATGGKDDNSYQWLDGPATKDYKVKPSSTVYEFTVTGTGANGCTNQAKTTITLQEAPQITIQPLAEVCEGVAVELKDAVLTEGLSLKFYEQDKTTQLASSKVTKDVAGSYTYYVQGTKDGIDCPSEMKGIAFTVKPKPVLAFSGNNTICEGKSATITVSGAGITWKDNNSTDNPRTFNPISTTTYTVTGKGSNSCTADKDIEIIVNPKPQIDWNTVTQGITSVVEGANLSVGIQLVKSTTAPYEYSWKHNGGDIANNNNSYNTTAAGSEEKFAVCVKDAKGCVSDTIKKKVEVTPQGGLLTVTLASSSDKICQGGMQILTATPQGGSGSYQYTWYKDGTDMGLAADVNTITVTDAAGYKVKVTDDGTIQQTAEVSKTITMDDVHTAPVVTVDNMTIISGTSTVLFSHVTPANGDYTYVWEDEGLVAEEVGKPYPRTKVLTADQDYTLYVKDNQGCISKKANATVTVDVSAFKVVAEARSQNSPVCINGKAWLNAKITGVSVPAEEDLTYTWMPDDGGLSATNVKNPVFTSSAQGTKEYFVKVEDKSGRVAGASVKVEVNSYTTPVLSLTTQDNAKCSGEIQVVADKSVSSYSWIIDNGSVTTGNSNQTLAVGTHNVKVFATDNNGCPSDTLDMNYEIFEKPTIKWDENNIWKVDAGQSVTIKAIADDGAEGNYTYNWIAPAGGNKTGNACSLTVSGTTTFKVSVKNEATGCESGTLNRAVEVRAQKPPVVITTNMESGLLCQGGSNMLEVISVTGGNGSGDFADYTIKWYKDGAEVGTGRTLAVSAAGTYTVKASDSEDRFATKDIIITVSTEAAPRVANGSQTVAIGQSAYLVGTVSGGQPEYTYKWWSDAARFLSGDNIPNPKTAPFNALGGKDYHYYVTDANNCVSDVATVTVNVVQSADPALFTVTASADRTPICMNNSTVLRAKTSRSLTNPTYSWTPSEGLDNASSATPKFTPTVAGTYTYTVKVTENATTSVTTQVRVIVQPGNAPVLALSSAGDCAGEMLTVTNTGESALATGYHWVVDGVAVDGNSSQYALGEGTNQQVQVSAMSANGCAADTVTGVFTRKPAPTLVWSAAAGYNVNVTVGNPIKMLVVPAPAGNTDMIYNWHYIFTPDGGSPGDKEIGYGTEELLQYALNRGSYKFFVSADLDGCSSPEIEKEIKVLPEGAKLAVSTDATVYTVCTDGSAVITAEAVNGDGNYTYTWYKGAAVAGSPVATGAIAAIAPTMNNEKYTVEVTDGAGEKATATVTLKFGSDNAPVVSSYAQTAVVGSSTVLMSSVTGISSSYEYTWTPENLLAAGEAGESHPRTVNLTNTTPDYYTYTYFVKDPNSGCVSAPATVKVTVETAPDALAIKATTDNSTLCKGNEAHLNVEATQGTLSATTTYKWSPVTYLSASNIANPVFTASVAGTYEYMVEVTDNGKTTVAKVNITVDNYVAPTIAWASGNPPANYKKGQELSVQVVGQGGSGSGYTYHWQKPEPASDNNTGIYSVNPANADKYEFAVYVTDANNCASSDTLTQTILPEEKEKIQIELSPVNTQICAVKEGAAYADLSVTLTKGPAKVNYAWSPKANSLTLTDADQAVAKVNIAGVTPGDYKFQVTVSDPDNADNYAMAEVTLTIWSVPVISFADASPSYQVGGSLSMQVSAINGTKPYTFNWKNPAPKSGDTYAVNPATEGSYYFKAYVEDVNGCRDSIDKTVTAGSTPSAEIQVDVTNASACAVAAGSGETASLVATVTSAHTNVSYEWKAKAGNTLTLTDADKATAKVDIAGVAAGSYAFEVTVTDQDNTSNKVTKEVTLTIQAAPAVDIDGDSQLALHKNDAFNLNIANKSENYSYIWAVSVYDMISNTWSDPVNEGINNSVSGVMADKDIRYVLTATDVMSDLKCKATDTTYLFRIPDAPVATIDTNTNKLNIKLKWAAVEMAEGYTVWSRKWDPYVLTSTEGAKYNEETSTPSTFWAEPSMDTLEFYYVTANRTIGGTIYHSNTSDTVGYYLFDIVYSDNKTTSYSFMPVFFDFKKMGITMTKDLFKILSPTNINYIRKWEYAKNPQGFIQARQMTPVVIPGDFEIKQGDVLQFEPKVKTGVSSYKTQFLQYGKLPAPYSIDLLNTHTTTSNFNLSFMLPQKLGYSTAIDVLKAMRDIRYIREWSFSTQKWNQLRLMGPAAIPVGTDFKLRNLLPLQFELETVSSLKWE